MREDLLNRKVERKEENLLQSQLCYCFRRCRTYRMNSLKIGQKSQLSIRYYYFLLNGVVNVYVIYIISVNIFKLMVPLFYVFFIY
jgi:hypothetical protein